MKTLIPIFTLIVCTATAQSSLIGKWKTVDDESGKERSVIELFEKNGEVHGKIIKIFPKNEKETDPVCLKCPVDDPRYKKKIIGMEILQHMKKSGDELIDGNILDPENGKIYKCKIWLEDANLMVRGYWGPFFRTQIWKKVH